MNHYLKILFYDNPLIDDELAGFLAQDPQFVQAEETFLKTSHEIAQAVGFSLYSSFERSLNDYLFRIADLYYLFGLGLRQEVLQAMQTED